MSIKAAQTRQHKSGGKYSEFWLKREQFSWFARKIQVNVFEGLGDLAEALVQTTEVKYNCVGFVCEFRADQAAGMNVLCNCCTDVG